MIKAVSGKAARMELGRETVLERPDESYLSLLNEPDTCQASSLGDL